MNKENSKEIRHYLKLLIYNPSISLLINTMKKNYLKKYILIIYEKYKQFDGGSDLYAYRCRILVLGNFIGVIHIDKNNLDLYQILCLIMLFTIII